MRLCVVSFRAVKRLSIPPAIPLSNPLNPCLYITPATRAEIRIESKMLKRNRQSIVITKMLKTTGLNISMSVLFVSVERLYKCVAY